MRKLLAHLLLSSILRSFSDPKFRVILIDKLSQRFPRTIVQDFLATLEFLLDCEIVPVDNEGLSSPLGVGISPVGRGDDHE